MDVLARSLRLTLSMVLPFVSACAGDDGDDDTPEIWADGVGSKSLAETVAGPYQAPAAVVDGARGFDFPYDGAPTWDGGDSCSDGPTPGSLVLRDLLISSFPQIDSVGIFNCRVIRGGSSMSLHSVGRALDVMIPTIDGDADNGSGDEIAIWLLEHAPDLGLQCIIWDRTIWSVSRTGEGVRSYGGTNPHIDHLHIEINEGAADLDLPWYAAPVGPERAPCPAVGVDGLVDDGPCQQRFGPARFWRRETGVGAGGALYWTNAFVGERPGNWARTALHVEAPGVYTVDALLDPTHARFAETRYRVVDAQGEHVVVVDQAAAGASGAARLGTFELDAEGGYVVLEDNVDAIDDDANTSIVLDAFVVLPSADEPETPDPPREEPEAPVADDDDPGTAAERVIVLPPVDDDEGGCFGDDSAAVLLAPLALLRRRRRR